MRFEVKYVQREYDRNGNERLYYRHGGVGKRIRLPGPVASPKFWDAYEKASGAPRAVNNSSSISWLINSYLDSTEFKTKVKSKIGIKARRNLLHKFCEEHGDKPFNKLTAQNLRYIRDIAAGPDLETPHAWNNLKKALSAVFEYALEHDLVTANPVKAVKKLPTNNPDGHHTWSQAEVEQFRDRHPIGSRQRLALEITLNLGQRRSDVVRIGRQHIRDGLVYIRQQKTKTELIVPMTRQLTECLAHAGDLTLLLTEWGKPFTAAGFGNFFRKACDDAGLPHCSAHGLRKACATALAEAGASSKQIMSVGGWKNLQDVQIYIEKAEQKRLAQSAISLLEREQK